MNLRSIWKLLGYYVSGNPLPEQNTIESWADERPENRKFINYLQAFRATSDSSRFDEEAKLAWDTLKNKIEKGDVIKQYSIRQNLKRTHILSTVYKVAASIAFLLFLAGAVIIYKYKIEYLTNNLKVETVNEGNSKIKFLLPDGTTVWLNSRSRLTYPKSFSGLKIREISLEGEAFFDVIHDKNAPFIVNTANFHIEVLGTTFNVKSYPDDENQVATLVRGSIRLKIQGDNKLQEQEVLLSPNQEVTYNKTINEIKLGSVEAAEASAWIEGKYRFKQKSFREIANELERGYHVKFSFSDSTTQSLNFTGTLSRNDKIDQIMQVIKIGVPITYKIIGDSLVIIYPK